MYTSTTMSNLANPNELSTMATLEYFRSTARHYDAACAADTRLRDIPFYVDLAKSDNGSVLEVGCGTGRILLPTARAGISIDGLDFSPEFLAILREKLCGEAPEVQARVSLYLEDMRSFSLGKTYHLMTIPFGPLQHLFTVDDQLAAFRCCHAHLNAGGRIAFNHSSRIIGFWKNWEWKSLQSRGLTRLSTPLRCGVRL